MSESISTPSPIASAPSGASFTSEPIAVTEPTPTAPVTATETAPVKPAPSELVSALAKASAAERLTKKQVAERDTQIATLRAELDAAKANGDKTAAIERELADIVANPGLLLKKGKSFDEILASIANTELTPTDPKIAELEARVNAQDEANKAAQAKADAERAERENADMAASNEYARKNITALIADEGVKPDATGIERWALVSTDTGAVERARLEVLKYITESEPDANGARARDLVCQALDQMEKVAREETATRAARLTPKQPIQPVSHNPDQSWSRPSEPTPAMLPPTIDANTRGNPLPPPARYQHGFTGLLR